MATETDVASDGEPASPQVSERVLEVKAKIRRKRRVRWALLGVLVVAVLTLTFLALLLVEFTIAEIYRNFGSWTEFLGAFLSPEFEDFTAFTREERISGSLDPIVASLQNPGTFVASLASETNLVGASMITIAIGFAGTVVGLPLALMFGVMGSERVTPFPFNFIFRGVMSTIRAIPALVWILIYVPLVGVSPVGAFLAVTTDTVGNLGRLFTDELEEIEDGPIEAIRSTGGSRPQTVLFGMLSQVSNGFIAWTLYILEINTRIAISLGVVGAGGIGQYIQLNVQQFRYGRAAAGILMVIVIVVSVELLSSRLRARLRPGENSGRGIVDILRGLTDSGKWFGAPAEPE